MAGSTRLELATSGVTGRSLSCLSCCNLRRCTAEEKLRWQALNASADIAIRLAAKLLGSLGSNGAALPFRVVRVRLERDAGRAKENPAEKDEPGPIEDCEVFVHPRSRLREEPARARDGLV
jgi:hypothetical protein